MHEGDEFSVMSVVPGTEISVFAPFPQVFCRSNHCHWMTFVSLVFQRVAGSLARGCLLPFTRCWWFERSVH